MARVGLVMGVVLVCSGVAGAEPVLLRGASHSGSYVWFGDDGFFVDSIIEVFADERLWEGIQEIFTGPLVAKHVETDAGGTFTRYRYADAFYRVRFYDDYDELNVFFGQFIAPLPWV